MNNQPLYILAEFKSGGNSHLIKVVFACEGAFVFQTIEGGFAAVGINLALGGNKVPPNFDTILQRGQNGLCW